MPNVINIIISYDFLWIFNKFQSKSLKLVMSLQRNLFDFEYLFTLYTHPPPPPTPIFMFNRVSYIQTFNRIALKNNFFRARINITDASIFFKVPMKIIKTVPIPIFVTRNTKNNTMYTVQDPHTFLYLF